MEQVLKERKQNPLPASLILIFLISWDNMARMSNSILRNIKWRTKISFRIIAAMLFGITMWLEFNMYIDIEMICIIVHYNTVLWYCIIIGSTYRYLRFSNPEKASSDISIISLLFSNLQYKIKHDTENDTEDEQLMHCNRLSVWQWAGTGTYPPTTLQ